MGLSINNENFFSFIRHKTGKNDLTLKELYDLSNISLIVKVYEDNSTIRHTLSHYISAIETRDNESKRKEQKFNPIIDKLKDIWEAEEIKAIHDLLQLIKTNKNRDIYLKTLEDIINAKEQFINGYIQKVTTSY